MGYSILMPSVDAVSIVPNPTVIGGALKIKIIVTEKTIILQPELIYSGEVHSGEE